MVALLNGKAPLPLAEEVAFLAISELTYSPENESLYKRIVASDSEVQSLAASIAEKGVLEPLVATLDGILVSGHRRLMAAKVAGLVVVPVLLIECDRCDFTDDDWVALLRDYNRQRSKTIAEKVQEAIVDADPEEAYVALLEERKQGDSDQLLRVDMSRAVKRSALSGVKSQLIAAVLEVVEEHLEYLPINLRKIHYELAQNKRPLKNAKKPNSTYVNDKKSYDTLTKDVVRMRTEGIIDHAVIDDETRPSIEWDVHTDAGSFLTQELSDFAKGYRRDLMQSQDVHVEILVEKNTVFRIVQQVAARYSISITSLRGQTSAPVRFKISERFKDSGKKRLVLLIASDFDPSGEAIAESVATSLRDEFGCPDLIAYKIAVTPEQAAVLELASDFEGLATKKKDSNLARFHERHGQEATCYELEALPVDELQRIVAESIDSVIDVDRLNQERELEKLDAVAIDKQRHLMRAAMLEAGIGDSLEADD